LVHKINIDGRRYGSQAITDKEGGEEHDSLGHCAVTMAEQIAKRESLRKTVKEFYALQSPKFKPDAESWMKHIHAIYGEEGHPSKSKSSDTQKRRSDKRRIAQSSAQPGKLAACAGSSDEELSIGKEPPLAHAGSDSSSDEDTSSLRPNPKSKRLRMERGSGKSESEERCQLSVVESLPSEESLASFGPKEMRAPGVDVHHFLSRENELVYAKRVDASNLEQDSGTSSDEEPDAVASDVRSSKSHSPSQTPTDDQSAIWSSSSQDEESTDSEEERSLNDALGITTGSGASSSGSKSDASGSSVDSSGLKAPPSKAEAGDEKSAADASGSPSSQDEESCESEEERSIDALAITTGGGASSSGEETDANRNDEASSGLKPPPSKAATSEEELAGVDHGSPEHRSTLAEEASTQDDCIGAVANIDDTNKHPSGSSDSSRLLEIWDDNDQDCESSQEAREEIDKISTSRLQMTLQGLKAKSFRIAATNAYDGHSRRKTSLDGTSTATDPESATYKGKTFYRGRCYRYREISIRTSATKIDAIVGVLRLLPDGYADCVLIVPFCDTVLGVEEEGVDFETTYQPSAFVRVHDELPPLSLRHFIAADMDGVSSVADVPIHIPTLVYEPQSADERYQFGYHWHKECSNRCGKRDDFRVLDLFAGCGGMSQGFHNNGFETVKAVEKDPSAVESLTTNLKVPVFQGDIREFLKRYGKNSGTMGRIDHIHASPPCQGFSRANRKGGKNDAANNALSMCFAQAVEIFRPVTATYENVLGLWDRKNRYYLKTLLVDLMKLGYQVRCTKLTALDYGDPQKRERLFIFAAHKAAILPGIPPKTHGNESTLHQHPYTTVREALYGLEKPNSGDSSDDDSNSRELGDDSQDERPNAPTGDPQVQLQADSPACTVRASKPPMHYDQNRPLTVREAAALQSFPADFRFSSGMNNSKATQYRQIGNAVPVEMATAVARSIRQSLLYYYRSEEDETGTVLI
jgi:DNA (cytosine-5)-methyltransferase 1